MGHDKGVCVCMFIFLFKLKKQQHFLIENGLWQGWNLLW